MMDEMANHATRVRRYIDKLGIEKVEDFIDRCLSLENLIDQHSPYMRRRADPKRGRRAAGARARWGSRATASTCADYINPPAFLEEQQKKIEDEQQRHKKFPERPERDVLLFLLEHAPLEPWEHDILSILREEAYYFAPQGQTKIMNEGWATYWHSTIMTQKALTDAEVIDYADHHSGTLATQPGRSTPTSSGIELFRDIEDRWNKGRFGKEWDECDDLRGSAVAGTRTLGSGREKIFEVRKHYNDVTFIDEFLTAGVRLEQKLFIYGYNEKHQRWEILDREFRKVKKKLLHMLTNFGQPIIEVVDGNFENRGELLLAHKHDGLDLKLDYARDTLRNLQSMWRRPVNLVTQGRGPGRDLPLRRPRSHGQEGRALNAAASHLLPPRRGRELG